MTNSELPAAIKKVMELDAKRTQAKIINCNLGIGVWNEEIGFVPLDKEKDYPFIASAPLMASIIRQLLTELKEAHGALEGMIKYSLHIESWQDEHPSLPNKAKEVAARISPLIDGV